MIKIKIKDQDKIAYLLVVPLDSYWAWMIFSKRYFERNEGTAIKTLLSGPDHILFSAVNGSQLATMKKSIPNMSLP